MRKEKNTIIKPNKNNSKNLESHKLIYAIITLIFGIILTTNSSKAVIIICYIIGAFSLAVGIFNLIKYYQIKRTTEYIDNNKLLLGLFGIIIGIIFVLLSSAIESFLRFVIGFILLIKGLSKSIDYINKKCYEALIIPILCIAMGLYTILAENVLFMFIGIILIIIALQDIMHYLIISSVKNKK